MQALNIYRFLTVEQMLALGLSKNAKSIRDKTLFALRHRGLIQSDKIGSFLPDVHYLTKQGATELAEIEKISVQTAPSKKRVSFSAMFAQHRFAQVDFHIGFREWVNKRGDAEVVLELQDFNRNTKSSNGKFHAATELIVPNLPRPVIPDGTFAVRLFSGPVALYVAELHRSTQTKAVTEQLKRYLDVIKSGALEQAHGIDVNPMVCSIHMQDAVLTGTKARLLNDPEFATFKSNFVFNTIDQMRSNFCDGWHLADGSPATPFPLNNPESDVRQ